MHVGIDLGTSNSTLAAFDGNQVSVVPNALGENLTPSVVRIDARGAVSVGRRAQRFLESDPANTKAEFKRLMGSGERLSFEAAEKQLSPQDLSAHVLASLLGDARDSLGFSPRGAVISTPALFELPQNHATVEAGRLAGLEEVVLIQEPIASAIAAGWRAESSGLWLVFDLGGGTLDVSLLETTEGRLRVVDHWGDNFLGGKDFDATLVDWAAARLGSERGLDDLSRSNPERRRAFSRLKVACEQARIELSRQDETAIVVPELCQDRSGASVDVELPVTRAELERLLDPLLGRCVAVCRTLLEHAKVSADDVGRVVFVGGPTLTPALRRLVGDTFGGRVAEGVDPMTVVARGAALFAATAGVEARPRSTQKLASGLALRLEFAPVTADLEPFVVGRFSPSPEETMPARVRVSRDDGEFVSPETTVAADGTFALQIRLCEHAQSRFVAQALAADGRELPLARADFAIVHGLSVADPPLSRSMGVGLVDDTVRVYFRKGTPLPARRTAIHETAEAVSRRGRGAALSIPLVQGEYHRAHRNRLVGRLEVASLEQDLPRGSRVEVTLELDRSGQIRAAARIPALGVTVEDVVHVLVPTASLETLASELAQAEGRAKEIRGRSFSRRDATALVALDAVPALLVEARGCLEAFRGGDADAGQRLKRLLLDADAALDAAEEALEWPELAQEADESAETAAYWLALHGTPAERQIFERAFAALEQARAQGEAAEVDRQIRVIRGMGSAAYLRDPEFARRELGWYEEHVAEAADVRRATALVSRGRKALERDDAEAARSTVRELAQLFPGTVEERRRNFGSGLK